MQSFEENKCGNEHTDGRTRFFFEDSSRLDIIRWIAKLWHRSSSLYKLSGEPNLQTSLILYGAKREGQKLSFGIFLLILSCPRRLIDTWKRLKPSVQNRYNYLRGRGLIFSFPCKSCPVPTVLSSSEAYVSGVRSGRGVRFRALSNEYEGGVKNWVFLATSSIKHSKKIFNILSLECFAVNISTSNKYLSKT